MTQIVDRSPGGLYVQTPDRQQIAFPLKHTEVQAKIAGHLSRVEVTQRFENPFTTTLEAVYIFPLPDEAAVDEMLIRIGDCTIAGRIKKRQEAQQIYEQAKQQGRTAGLLEQERDNIFTQSLANIQPGEQIDVIIRYSTSLPFEGGNYEFVFPMVVGPRYIPGTPIEENAVGGGSAPTPMTLNQDTDLVPDASRLNAPILPPGTRSLQDIDVTIEIDAGVEIREVRSPSHHLQISHEGQIVRVSLANGDMIPNKDLILRYQVAGENTQATVLTQSDEKGGHFALYLIPAVAYPSDRIVPKDIVFLMDTSGSQMGAPLRQCQELMRRFINGLNPDDTFSIIDFSDTTQQLSPVPLTNTPQHRSRAIQYINQLTAGGGTEMLRGMRAVLNFPVTDPGRLRSIVLLTDGYIGNENQILAEVQQHLQPGNRLYSFGAGSSVNRFLLNRLAELGRGISSIIRHDEPTDVVVERFFRQINNPILTNIQVQWQGLGKSPKIYPSPLPDLFAEQPLVLFGRQADRCAGKLHVTGIAAGGTRYQQTFTISFAPTGNPAIAQLWGRSRIKDLMNRMVSGDTKSGVEAVTETAIAYQLLSQYTAFVAVSDEVRVNPSEGSVSVQVPVEMPEGISYEGIFGGVASAAPPLMAAAPKAPIARARQHIKRAAPPIEIDLSADRQDTSPPKAKSRRAAFAPDISTLFENMRAGFSGLPAPNKIEDESELVSFDESQSELTAPLAPQQIDAAIEESHTEALEIPGTRLQVVSATGLDAGAIALLTQHLRSIQLPPGLSGDLVFEFQVNKGRVTQVVFDDRASSVQEQTEIEAIRRSLLTWPVPKAIASSIILRLRIEA